MNKYLKKNKNKTYKKKTYKKKTYKKKKSYKKSYKKFKGGVPPHTLYPQAPVQPHHYPYPQAAEQSHHHPYPQAPVQSHHHPYPQAPVQPHHTSMMSMTPPSYKGRTHGRINVNNINFTQKSISHRFSRGDKNLDTTYSELKNIVLYLRKKYNNPNYVLTYNDVFKDLRDYLEFFNLNVIVNDSGNEQNRFYSCENRRLCVLKHLYKKGYFDGDVMCTITLGCHHDINLPNNQKNGPFIQMGNKRGKFCDHHQFE